MNCIQNHVSAYLNEIPNNWENQTQISFCIGFSVSYKTTFKHAFTGGIYYAFGEAVSNVAVPLFRKLNSENCTDVLKIFTKNFTTFTLVFRDLKKGFLYGSFFSLVTSINILVNHLLENWTYRTTVRSSINATVYATFLSLDPVTGLKIGSLDLLLGVFFKNFHPYIKEKIEQHKILERSFLELKMEDFPANWGSLYLHLIKTLFVQSVLTRSPKFALIGTSFATMYCLMPLYKIVKESKNLKPWNLLFKSSLNSMNSIKKSGKPNI